MSEVPTPQPEEPEKGPLDKLVSAMGGGSAPRRTEQRPSGESGSGKGPLSQLTDALQPQPEKPAGGTPAVGK